MNVKRFFEGRVALVCVGNELNGDDAFGHRLSASLGGFADCDMKVIYASTAPENFIGEIIGFKPERVILVDAADCGGRPGEIMVLDGKTLEGFHVSSHRTPLKAFSRCMSREGIGVVFIGVQAKNTGVGEPMSLELEEAVKKMHGMVRQARKKSINNRKPISNNKITGSS